MMVVLTIVVIILLIVRGCIIVPLALVFVILLVAVTLALVILLVIVVFMIIIILIIIALVRAVVVSVAKIYFTPVAVHSCNDLLSLQRGRTLMNLICSLNPKDKECQTVKEAFVCLSVTHFKNYNGICCRLFDSDGFYYVKSSRISLSLLLVRISSTVIHSISMPLCP